MVIKMKDIFGFTSFYSTVKNQKMPMKTAYKLAQLGRAIDGELQFYREKLQAIIAEYGELDEQGNPIQTEDGNGVKLRVGMESLCHSAIEELQNIEVTLPDLSFSVTEFEGVELTVTEMGAILPFITE